MTSDSSSPARILVLEDDPAQQALLQAQLGNVPGFSCRITAVTTCASAREALLESPFDVALVDLHVPDSRGVATIAALRTASDYVPLVVLTGYDADESLALECLRAGADDYLEKADTKPQMLRRAIGFAMYRGREQRVRELENLISQYRGISSAGQKSSIARALARGGPVRERQPRAFESLAESYSTIFSQYMRQRVTGEAKPLNSMTEVATRMGELGGGPRDMLDLHVQALELAVSRQAGARANSFATEGRLLAVEMMGLLVEFYRVGLGVGRLSRSEDDQ